MLILARRGFAVTAHPLMPPTNLGHLLFDNHRVVVFTEASLPTHPPALGRRRWIHHAFCCHGWWRYLALQYPSTYSTILTVYMNYLIPTEYSVV